MADLFSVIEELKSPDFKAPSAVWEDFTEGHIWDDFQKELQTWLADTWEKLEAETDPELVSQLRGRARTIREVLQMPAGIIEMLKQKEEQYG